MLIVNIHLITGLVLALVMIVALFISQPQQLKGWLVLARIGYVILLVSGLYLLTWSMKSQLGLSVLKLIVAIATIGIFEVAVAHKKRHQKDALRWSVSTLIGLLATVLIGFMLA